jgi:hypothetical protein
VLVGLLRMAAFWQPRSLPTNRLFLRFSTTRFISRSLTLLSIGTAPSPASTFSSFQWFRTWLTASRAMAGWDFSASTNFRRACAQKPDA